MTFEVKIRYPIECTDKHDGKNKVTALIQMLGLQRFTVEHVPDVRSDAQNRARWLFCDQMAHLLNDSGLDMRAFISEGIDMPWSKDTFMSFVWKPTFKMLTGKTTTRKETTQDINRIYDVINRAVTERSNGMIKTPPFPSVDSLMERDNY